MAAMAASSKCFVFCFLSNLVKPNCRTCDQILTELEKIDDELDAFGIGLVRIVDPPLAKRYGIKTFPAVVYFRNSVPLTFDGKYIHGYYI